MNLLHLAGNSTSRFVIPKRNYISARLPKIKKFLSFVQTYFLYNHDVMFFFNKTIASRISYCLNFQWHISFQTRRLGDKLMISATSSALSALSAFSTKLNSNANNIANLQSEGFKKTRVTNESTADQGVKAVVDTVNTQGMMRLEETSNGTEMVELSNVDMAQELADSTLNTRFYEANLKTIKAEDEMTQSVLDLRA